MDNTHSSREVGGFHRRIQHLFSVAALAAGIVAAGCRCSLEFWFRNCRVARQQELQQALQKSASKGQSPEGRAGETDAQNAQRHVVSLTLAGVLQHATSSLYIDCADRL